MKTKRHDEPRFILKNENRIVEALILNHADLELIMLEKLVLRKPPFVGKDGKVKGGFYCNLSYKNITLILFKNNVKNHFLIWYSK